MRGQEETFWHDFSLPLNVLAQNFWDIFCDNLSQDSPYGTNFHSSSFEDFDCLKTSTNPIWKLKTS